MREMGRTDIRALTILNHQRGQPPLERSANPFGDVVMKTAEKDHCGLMTAWTLYRLARNFERLTWKHEYVAPLFTRNGVISPEPAHYQAVGQIEKRWSHAISVNLNDHLTVGDRIAIDCGVDYVEQSVDSLQINRVSVDEADAGALVGIGTAGTTPYQIGSAVFRLRSMP